MLTGCTILCNYSFDYTQRYERSAIFPTGKAIFPTLHACISRLLNRNMLVIAFRGSHTLIIHRTKRTISRNSRAFKLEINGRDLQLRDVTYVISHSRNVKSQDAIATRTLGD